MSLKTGVVILGHGSGAATNEANSEIYQLTSMIKPHIASSLVETAIMNRKSGMQSVTEAVEKVIVAGAQRVIIVPMFLANGIHVQKDIPAEAEALRQIYKNVDIQVSKHIGADRRIVDILLDRIREIDQ